MKAAIIGGGNIGLSLAEGLIHANVCQPQEITITRRNAAPLKELSKRNFKTSTDNKIAIADAEAIFICVLPQQLDEALSQIQSTIDLKSQL